MKSDHCFDSLPFVSSPTGGSICRNDGKWYEGFLFFVGEAHATTFRRSERGVSGGFDCFTLYLTLSRGEREQMAENQNNGRTLPSLRGKENKLQGITTIVEVQSSDSLSPWERARERAKPFGLPLSRFSKNHPFKTDTDKRDGQA